MEVIDLLFQLLDSVLVFIKFSGEVVASEFWVHKLAQTLYAVSKTAWILVRLLRLLALIIETGVLDTYGRRSAVHK